MICIPGDVVRWTDIGNEGGEHISHGPRLSMVNQEEFPEENN